MRVTILGTGSAIPSGRTQSGILVEDDPLLFDCGSGVLHNLHRSRVNFEDVGHVLLTHNHLDHISDLLPLIKADWLVGREEIEIYGPPGTQDTVDGLFDTFEYMQDRIEVGVEEVEPGESFSIEAFDRRIETLETKHSVTSMAYKVDDSFIYSGDTEPIDEMSDFVDGCDVLVHECSFPDEIDVGNHTKPSGLADVLEGVEVNEVYLTHLYPHVQGNERKMVETIEKKFDGRVLIPQDMETIEVDEK